MSNAIVVSGRMSDEKTIHLDVPLPIALGKLRLVIEPTSGTRHPTISMTEALDRIRASQSARGYVARSAEEIQASIDEERNSWGDEE